MASFFEPDSFLLDPTSYNELPSSFLSFSSFADFTSPPSPSLAFDLSSWDYGFSSKFLSKQPPTHDCSQPSSIGGSDTSSPRDPFSVIEAAFEPPTPAGDIGIFHTPGPAGPSKLSGTTERQLSIQSFRSSSSSDTWEDPLTPGLTSKSSVESFASASTIHSHQPYSWDEASTSLGGASYQPHYTAHRTTSNPILNQNRPRVPRPMASMPALREEDTLGPWFDGSEQPSSFESTGSTSQLNAGGVLNLDEDGNLLAEGFDWAFGDYGLGVEQADSSFPVFEDQPSSESTQAWLPTPVQDTESFSLYDYSAIADMPTFCIDPSTLMGGNAEEELSRPSSAPGYNPDSITQMLSVPQSGAMTRSVSSDGFVSRHAPRDLFSYAPQQIPAGPPLPQPLYTTEPSQSYHPRAVPPTVNQQRRASSHGLTVHIQQPQYSTYAQLPLTPQSATFGDFQSQQPQPIAMTRAGTQPLPTTRRLSTSEMPQDASRTPAHLLRAQALAQMQEAKDEAHRQEMHRIAASRRVSMGQPSVMQPQAPARSQPQIMGWEGPSAQTASLPILTTTPLVNVHPSSFPHRQPPTTPHRVHPPPHPGTPARPIARIPISPIKQRKASATPAKRTPTGKRRGPQPPGTFSWGEATFINFTSEDAEKLLTGVAPSGSQSKRKREEDAVKMVEDGVIITGGEMERDRSKRSRSGEATLD